MSDKTEDTNGIRFSQVVAGALAAVTAALIGSTMGVAGTVVGAGLASVISTVGGAVYLRSIQRTRESVRTVRAKVVGRSGGATVLVSDEDPEEPAGAEVEAAPGEAEPERSDQPPSGRRRRWPTLVVTTVAAFALGMLAITGVEWLRGESLSGGSGTTFGSIVAPHHGQDGGEDPSTPATSTTTPTSTTTTPDSTTTNAPTTTSTRTSSTPPGDSSATTTPPVTTTTEATPPEGATQPSG
jgi:hypothetical protein